MFFESVVIIKFFRTKSEFVLQACCQIVVFIWLQVMKRLVAVTHFDLLKHALRYMYVVSTSKKYLYGFNVSDLFLEQLLIIVCFSKICLFP